MYSAAAAVCGGEVLGFTARANVRGTVFSALPEGEIEVVDLGGENCCRAGSAIIYSADGAINGLSVAVRFAADRKLAAPPTAALCASGATVIAELSDEPMSVQSRRETLAALEADTKRLHCAAVSAAPGRGESTTDKTYYGLCAVVDDGETLAVSESGSAWPSRDRRFQPLRRAYTRADLRRDELSWRRPLLLGAGAGGHRAHAGA